MNNGQWIMKIVRRLSGLRHYSLCIIHCTLIFCLSGCLSSKQLRSNEYLLTAQTIRGNRTIPAEALESLIPQKPNRRILGLPITPPLWFYQLGLRRYNREAALRELQDKTNEFEQQSQQLAGQPEALKQVNRRYGRQLKRLRLRAEEGNWVMRNLGEPPSYFAEADAKANAVKMQKYLSDKGFFNAQTTYKLDTLRRRQIRVNYLIKENEGFYLRNITYQIADPRIDSIVRQSFDKSQLRVGDRFDFDNMSGERLRIESLLRDQGYYAFSRQYIRATDVDTIRRGHDRRFHEGLEPGDSTRRNVDVALQIVNPPGKSAHPIYYIGEMEMQINSGEEIAPVNQAAVIPANADTVSRSGIAYLLGDRDISVRLLDSKILLRPNQLYSQTNYRDTQRQLFLLNQFKFVNLNFVDTTNRRLQTLITATPLDKYEATAEGGVTGLLYQGTGYPGGFGSLIFRVRNMFGGLETLETSARFGLEAQTGFVSDPNSNRSVYSSQELGLSSSLIFPQILFPGPLRFRFNRYAPRTQISLSFNNTFRPDFKRSLLRATMAYTWQTTPAKQFNFLIADINLINAGDGTEKVISDAFKKQLDTLSKQGSTVYLSFRRSLSSSFSFAYTYNTNTPGQNRRANFLRTVVESGGTTLNFFSDSQLRKFFNTTDSTGLQFYKYLRFNVDYRHYIPLRPRTTLAFRINTGLVYGYGSNRTAPYEKLFFAGGSNSIRAWLPRRLGPGSEWPQTKDGRPVTNPEYPRSEQFLYTVEKPGDMLIEASAELRGRLFHLGADVNGAIFVDAGNVWTLSNNTTRPGTVFRFDTFIPQIAVGTGVGLRLDFSFFVIRFDGGIKVWDPARRYIDSENQEVDKRFLLPEFSLRRLSSGPNPLVINFGIGYPF